jgi:CheY-like chemotaxis protein
MRSATRGASVTRQLLAVGGQQPIDRIAVDLNTIITKLEGSLRRVVGPSATFTLNLEPTLPDVEGDSTQIEQVLLHLAGNAGEAIGDDGAVTITTSSTIAEDIRARNYPQIDAREYVWLTVRDTGHGMDARTRDHVFEPYFTTKSAGLSAGLGLPVVYGIVNQLGGAIAVDSEVGQGTAFTIALRRASTARSARSAASPPSVAAAESTRTIVLVDDEDDVRSVMKAVLCQKGYSVLEASSGADAIQLLAGHPGSIDMLVTDVLMPGMSGRELYEHLARRHPGLKVLYVSGYADDAFAHEQEWGNAFLSKPFSLETLAQRVQDGLTSV